MNRLHLLLTACLLSLLMCGNLFAQWPDDPAQNLLICNRSGEQTIPKVAATSDGGCYVCWYDHSSGNYDVYLQRVDGDGVIQWATNGILVSNHTQNSWLTDWDMTVDAADHCIIAVNDIRAGGDWDIYGYRISPTGEFVWGADGIAISANDGFEPDPRVVGTSGGNIAFTWMEETAQGTVVNLRKLTPAGADVYTAGTITLTSDQNLSIPRIAASDNDAVILQFLESQGTQIWSPRWVYMQKYDSLGNELWFEDPTAVMTTNGIGIQMEPDLISDGAGGAYSFWYDSRNNELHTYAQHVTNMGTTAWTENGVRLDQSGSELQTNPTAALLDDGLALFYSCSNSNQSLWGVQAQKLASDGSLAWGTNGAVVEALAAEQCSYLFAFRQDANASVVYKRGVPGSGIQTYVKASSLTPAGEFAWTTNIADLCTVASDKNHVDADVNPDGQIIAVWPDSRIENGDIYLQNVNPNGTLGPLGEPQPWIEIVSPAQDTTVHRGVQVVTCEVGNFVMGLDGIIRLTASMGETSYSVASGGSTTFPPIQLSDAGEWMLVAELITAEPDPPDADTVMVNYVPPTINIVQPEEYYSWYLTLDSLDVHFETEFIEFTGPNGNSVNVDVKYSPNSTEPAEPFANFNHYSQDSIWIHFDEIGSYFIKLRLVSPPGPNGESYGVDSLQIDVGETAADDSPIVPNHFALHPAYPNPFNPETTLRFDVQQTAQVSLTIHDLLGRAVAVLTNDVYDAGEHRVTWDASGFTSGVYFARMQTGEFVTTQKLMLLR